MDKYRDFALSMVIDSLLFSPPGDLAVEQRGAILGSLRIAYKSEISREDLRTIRKLLVESGLFLVPNNGVEIEDLLNE